MNFHNYIITCLYGYVEYIYVHIHEINTNNICVCYIYTCMERQKWEG